MLRLLLDLLIFSNLEQIILTRPSQEKLMEEAKRQGMITLRQDGIIKALEGIISLEEVLSITSKY